MSMVISGLLGMLEGVIATILVTLDDKHCWLGLRNSIMVLRMSIRLNASSLWRHYDQYETSRRSKSTLSCICVLLMSTTNPHLGKSSYSSRVAEIGVVISASLMLLPKQIRTTKIGADAVGTTQVYVLKRWYFGVRHYAIVLVRHLSFLAATYLFKLRIKLFDKSYLFILHATPFSCSISLH
ncbi:hypothetical protein O9992_15285 [Vibrio lentus]|nr:hypothetical protein [Vibrio lentus]